MDNKSTFKSYKKKAADLLQDNQKVQHLLGSAKEKLSEVLRSNDKIRLFSDQIFLLIRMVKAHFAGEYAEFPWKTMMMIVGALLYFVTPFDLIPDFIPGLGYTDDISIVYWVYRSIQEDIERFKAWEGTIEIS